VTQESGTPLLTLTRLRENLTSYFNTEELRTLCFDLGIPYEDLGGEGRADRIRELVAYCDRHARTADLIATCSRLRPQATWDESPVFSRSIGDSLAALRELMQHSEVQSAVSAFSSVFQATCEQIGVLACYKGLHDRFQKLEDSYRILYRAQKRLVGDESDWEDIRFNEPDLQSRVDELLDFARQACLTPSETLWVTNLDKARARLSSAIEAANVQLCQDAIGAMWRILDGEPSRCNSQLVMAARALNLNALIRAMTTAGDRLSRPSLEEATRHQFDKLEQGIQDMTRLNNRLVVLLDAHDNLQRIDDHLRRVEASLEKSRDDLVAAWQDLEPRTQLLCEGGEISRAAVLKAKGDELGQALASGSPAKIRDAFLKYRSEASRIFSQVDADLLALCGELQRVDRPLAGLMDGET
jgi:hypothetical protein